MRDLVRRAVRDPDMLARNLFIEITGGCPGRDFRCEVDAVWNWVRENIRFVRDIHGVETLQSFRRTIELGIGDCDDQSVAISSILEAGGHPTRFVAMGFRPGQFSHVFTETRLGDRWISLETTVPGAHIGWYPRGVESRMIQKIQSY